MDCYICLDKPDIRIPLLRCGHYVCCECYCGLKRHKYNECQICKKKLIRGARKNK